MPKSVHFITLIYICPHYFKSEGFKSLPRGSFTTKVSRDGIRNLANFD